MDVVEKYETDYYAVITLLAMILLLVFLVVAVLYFNSVANLTPPTRSESTFLLWTCVVMIVLVAALAAYSLVRIFFYTLPVVKRLPPNSNMPMVVTDYY